MADLPEDPAPGVDHPPRSRRRDRVVSPTRERILDVALESFVRKGYMETSLREIAAEIGITKASLYYHFESKADIALGLHLRMHHLVDELEPAMAGDAPGDAWTTLVNRLITIALKNRRLIEFHLRNQEVLTEAHRPGALSRHDEMGDGVEVQLMTLVADQSLPIELRVRRMATLGIVASVLLGASALADLPDAVLEEMLRKVAVDVLPPAVAGQGAG